MCPTWAASCRMVLHNRDCGTVLHIARALRKLSKNVSWNATNTRQATVLPMAPTAQAIRASNSNIPEGRSNGVVPCFPHPSGMILWWHSRLLLTSRRLWVAPWGQGGTGCCMLRCICHPQRLMDSCTCHWPLRQIAQHTLQQQADSAIGNISSMRV